MVTLTDKDLATLSLLVQKKIKELEQNEVTIPQMMMWLKVL